MAIPISSARFALIATAVISMTTLPRDRRWERYARRRTFHLAQKRISLRQ